VEPSASLLANLRQNLQDPLTRLFVQLILIVLVARICGAVAQQVGQPAVIGEMLAGILLGPSLVGWAWPAFFQFVFPASSLGTLRMLSQIGVCLFMFVVGMDLDLGQLRPHARTAVLVSQVSITAFPVLARILEERGLMKSALGSRAIACAPAADVTAWSVLAFVVAIVKAGGLAASALSIGLVLVFVGLMLFWIKPRMPRWTGHAAPRGSAPSKGVIASVLTFVFASALVTDVIGIHALFGSFLAGVVMPPRAEFRQFLKVRLEHFSSAFLLPLFFAFTGLRTQVGLLDEPTGWLICSSIFGAGRSWRQIQSREPLPAGQSRGFAHAGRSPRPARGRSRYRASG
jgi:Kef-type K+ transport system membrane component KefB